MTKPSSIIRSALGDIIGVVLGLMSGLYYRDEDNAAVYEVVDGKLVYQSVLPHGNPVIFLPSGTLKALLTTP